MRDSRRAVIVLIPLSQLARARRPGSDEVDADCGHRCWMSAETRDLVAGRVRAGSLTRTTCLDCLPDVAWEDLVGSAIPPGWRATAGFPLPWPQPCGCPNPLEAVVLVDGDVRWRRKLRGRGAERTAAAAARVTNRAMLSGDHDAVLSYLQCPTCAWTVVLLHAVHE